MSLFLFATAVQALTVTSGPTATAIYLTSTTVEWTSDVPSDSYLVGGTNPGYLNGFAEFAYNPALTTTHSVMVTNLLPGTAYAIEVLSKSVALSSPTPSFFSTPATDDNLAFDFALMIDGGRRMTVGHSMYLYVHFIKLAGTFDASPRRWWPYDTSFQGDSAGITVSAPVDYNDCQGVPDQNECGSEDNDSVIHVEVHADASVTPGLHNVTFNASLLGASHSVTIPIQVEPVPGPLTRAAISSIPPIPDLAKWEFQMTADDMGDGMYGAKHWCDQATIESLGVWDGSIQYYDGERMFYQIADYTGDPFWNTCAHYVQHVYRDGYVLPNNGGVQGYRIFPHGMFMDYLRTGDPLSKQGVLEVASHGSYTTTGGGVGSALIRETSYTIQAYLKAIALGVQPPFMDRSVDFLLGHLDQMMVSQTANYMQPFMVGLACAALIEYYNANTRDPRIPVAVKQAADWMWQNARSSVGNTFWYESSTRAQVPAGAPDLNMLIAPAYAWLWGVTGDPKYQQEGDALFQAGVEGAWLGQGKQFTQNYRWSFDFVKWRQHPDSVFDGPPPVNPPNPTTTVAPGTFGPQVYPNPWRSDKHTGRQITFNQLVPGGAIKIFTTSGHKVKEISVTGTSMPWNLDNDKGEKVASGIYVYLITDGQGNKAKGKVAVIK